jgi:hypothetical protein
MKNFSLIIILLFVLQSCHKYVYLTASKESSLPAATALKIDSTFQYYIRKVYKTDSSGFNKIAANTPGEPGKKLIEVEYLFYSPKQGKLIYFSTIPDKYQNYYDAHFLGDTIVNVYDIRTLYFGTLKNNKSALKSYEETVHSDEAVFEFKNDITKDVWAFQNNNNHINLVSITELKGDRFIDYIPLKYALERRVQFTKMPHYEIVYHNYRDAGSGSQNDFPRLINNTLYIITENPSAKKKKYRVYFQFNKPVKDAINQLYFPDKRITYNPIVVLDK